MAKLVFSRNLTPMSNLSFIMMYRKPFTIKKTLFAQEEANLSKLNDFYECQT